MSFPIVRVVTLAALGWLLYRSRGPLTDWAEERPKPGDREQDSTAPRRVTVKGPKKDDVAEPPDVDITEPEAAAEPDDLTRIRGIGPAIAKHLNAAGITPWAQLAATEVSALQAILDEAGPRYRVHKPKAWPGLAAELASAN